jgi:hypothetical protein
LRIGRHLIQPVPYSGITASAKRVIEPNQLNQEFSTSLPAAGAGEAAGAEAGGGTVGGAD